MSLTNAINKLYGRTIILRPANLSDRKTIYDWLANSDITSLMLGPPTYPDAPVPTWDQFVNDYADYYFDDTQPMRGRCFILEHEGQAVGQVSYNEIYGDGSTELDIWLAGHRYMGQGYGADALNTLCDYLHEKCAKEEGFTRRRGGAKEERFTQKVHCTRFYIAPSQRNQGAVRAYNRAGFMPAGHVPSWFVPDYNDAVVLMKQMPVKI